MDPALPNQTSQTNQTQPASQPAPQQFSVTPTRSREMEVLSQPSKPTAEKSQNIEKVQKVFDKGPTVESAELLKLNKETGIEGLTEVHDHQLDPIKLPSLLTDVGIESTGLPAGALTHKDVTVTLPLNQTQMKQGLHQSVKKSLRWMAEWCVKQIKEAHRIAKLKKEQSVAQLSGKA